MRNLPRRMAIGIMGAGTIMAMAAGATTAVASAAVATPRHHATTDVRVARDWPAVREGASGNRVYVIQFLLNFRSYPVPTDGKFGPATTKAVKAFQTANHLKVDGIVGGGTWEKLIAVPLKLGDSNLAVKGLQYDLKHAWGKDVPVDGKFEAKTKKAVIEIQAKYLPNPHDGVVDARTWNVLIKNKL
jgi:zinc D-Ala-D-Ala carboxypeptidase